MLGRGRGDGKKPSLTEFYLRGFPLEVALAILARWETLTEVDLQRLGFDREVVNLAEWLGRSTFH